MQVVSAETALDLEVVVDPDAEPIDFDQVLAEFLLRVVRQRNQTTPAGTPDGGSSIRTTGDKERRRQ